ncbi:MAG TPA: hypothetical protein VFM59_08045 [Salinimicrobium sp.]|nr:hypothetical protein [Salinimicrobium sp.]
MEVQPKNFEEGQEQSPELYSKSLILIFALLFSVLFAAALLMANLYRLGKTKQLFLVLIFALLYLFLTALLLQAFGLNPSWTFVANVIGAAILNEFFWNRFIGKDFNYQKRSWIPPVLISLAFAMLVFYLIFLI